MEQELHELCLLSVKLLDEGKHHPISAVKEMKM